MPSHAAEYGTFDAIIASHVIEYMPDPIGWFNSLALLLKNGGLVSLVIPDKRCIFDFFNPLTSTGDYLYAHHCRRNRHSRESAFANMAYQVSSSGNITWSPGAVRDFKFRFDESLAQGARAFADTVEDESAPYSDFHATFYTPSSFALIMLELGQVGVLPFRFECAFPTAGCEFFVTLRKGTPSRLDPAELDRERLRLMKALIRETGEQSRWIVDDSPESAV